MYKQQGLINVNPIDYFPEIKLQNKGHKNII